MEKVFKKKDIINEILRFCRTLTQMKYNSEDDKNIKRLIAENLRNLAEIEKREVEARERAKAEKELAKLQACLYEG